MRKIIVKGKSKTLLIFTCGCGESWETDEYNVDETTAYSNGEKYSYCSNCRKNVRYEI